MKQIKILHIKIHDFGYLDISEEYKWEPLYIQTLSCSI
jgi:hypothetical protein